MIYLLGRGATTRAMVKLLQSRLFVECFLPGLAQVERFGWLKNDIEAFSFIDTQDSSIDEATGLPIVSLESLNNKQLTKSVFIKSPGIPPSQITAIPATHIVTEWDLFFALRPLIEAKQKRIAKVIGITGSNGKSTVTAMTAAFLQSLGKSAVICGNFGKPMGEVVLSAIENGLPDYFVCELSSYQLADSDIMPLDAAAILNITPDHLDWHGDERHYRAAKWRIAENTHYLIAGDSAFSAELLEQKKPDVLLKTYDGSQTAANNPDFKGSVARKDALITIRFASPHVVVDSQKQSDKIALPKTYQTAHQAQNILSAAMLTKSVLPSAARNTLQSLIDEGLTQFEDLPHRGECVAEIHGIKFFNNSKATNIGAMMAAVSATKSQISGRVWLLVGGLLKGARFSSVAKKLSQDTSGIAVYGQDAELIMIDLRATDILLWQHKTLETSVKKLFDQATPGDGILLAPGCASLDQFPNYVERGKVFAEIIKTL